MAAHTAFKAKRFAECSEVVSRMVALRPDFVNQYCLPPILRDAFSTESEPMARDKPQKETPKKGKDPEIYEINQYHNPYYHSDSILQVGLYISKITNKSDAFPMALY